MLDGMSAVLGLLGGALVGGISTWLLKPKPSVEQAPAFIALASDLKHAQAMIAQAEQRATQLKTDLENVQAAERVLQIQNATLVQSLEDTKANTQKWEQQLQQQFEALTLKATQAARESLEQTAKLQDATRQEALNKDVKQLLDPLTQLIKEHEKKVQAIEKQTTSDYSALRQQLEMTYKQTQELIGAKERIIAVLSDNKGRGDWGEFKLERLLEMSGLIEGRHFDKQVAAEGVRPDFKIYMPNGNILYIDVKTLVGTLRTFETSMDNAQSDEERKRLTQSLRSEVLSLSKKSYQTQTAGSVDFVVLFVPRESMLRVPLEEHPTLMEEAYDRGVILSSPLILMALLKTVAQGWAQSQIADNAREVQTIGRELHKRTATFLEKMDAVRSAIHTVQSKYQEAESSFKGRFMPQLNKLDAYGCKSEKAIPAQYKTLEEADASLTDVLSTKDDEPVLLTAGE